MKACRPLNCTCSESLGRARCNYQKPFHADRRDFVNPDSEPCTRPASVDPSSLSVYMRAIRATRAPMAELVDASDSKSDSARSAGSIPARGTIILDFS